MINISKASCMGTIMSMRILQLIMCILAISGSKEMLYKLKHCDEIGVAIGANMITFIGMESLFIIILYYHKTSGMKIFWVEVFTQCLLGFACVIYGLEHNHVRNTDKQNLPLNDLIIASIVILLSLQICIAILALLMKKRIKDELNGNVQPSHNLENVEASHTQEVAGPSHSRKRTDPAHGQEDVELAHASENIESASSLETRQTARVLEVVEP